MSALITEIKLLGENLREGQTYRGQCPRCMQGKDFTLTRKGEGLVYHCYRASCGFRGSTYSRGGTTVSSRAGVENGAIRNRGSTSNTSVFDVELLPVGDPERQYLLERWGMSEWHVETSGVRYYLRGSVPTFVFPIFAPSGVRRGWVERTDYFFNQGKRTRSLLDGDGPRLCWTRRETAAAGGTGTTTLATEDILSALRAEHVLRDHDNIRTVALLGTNVSKEDWKELRDNTDHIVWALDKDAAVKALKLHKEIGSSFVSSRVLLLERDLKDLSEDKLTEKLSEVFDFL